MKRGILIVALAFVGLVFANKLQASENKSYTKGDSASFFEYGVNNTLKTPKKTTIKKRGGKDKEPVDYGKKNFLTVEGNMTMNTYTLTEQMTINGFTANKNIDIKTSIYNLEMNYKRRWAHFYYGAGFGYFYGKDAYTFPEGMTLTDEQKNNDNYNFGMIGLYADGQFDMLTSKFTPFIECKVGFLWKFYEEQGYGRQNINCLYLKPAFGLAYMNDNGRFEFKLEPIKFFNSKLLDDTYELGVTIGYSVRF